MRWEDSPIPGLFTNLHREDAKSEKKSTMRQKLS